MTQWTFLDHKWCMFSRLLHNFYFNALRAFSRVCVCCQCHLLMIIYWFWPSVGGLADVSCEGVCSADSCMRPSQGCWSLKCLGLSQKIDPVKFVLGFLFLNNKASPWNMKHMDPTCDYRTPGVQKIQALWNRFIELVCPLRIAVKMYCAVVF